MTSTHPSRAPEHGECAASPPALEPPVDGRQSEAALAIARGSMRLLKAHGFAALPEVTLASGRRADLMALSEAGEIWIVEIKSSIADFAADQKWPEYRAWCDRLFFAVAPEFPIDLLPADTGLILADRYGGEIARPAPEHRLAGSRRKTLTLRLARLGAQRMQALIDPEGHRMP